MKEEITEDLMYEIMSKAKIIDTMAKITFERPPYHCRFLESSYKPKGAIYREEHRYDF